MLILNKGKIQGFSIFWNKMECPITILFQFLTINKTKGELKLFHLRGNHASP